MKHLEPLLRWFLGLPESQQKAVSVAVMFVAVLPGAVVGLWVVTKLESRPKAAQPQGAVVEKAEKASAPKAYRYPEEVLKRCDAVAKNAEANAFMDWNIAFHHCLAEAPEVREDKREENRRLMKTLVEEERKTQAAREAELQQWARDRYENAWRTRMSGARRLVEESCARFPLPQDQAECLRLMRAKHPDLWE